MHDIIMERQKLRKPFDLEIFLVKP